MEIERSWGKWPGWFESLTREQQADIMADYMLTTEERKKAARKQAAAARPGGRGRR
jgi:hypothetical protein